MYIEFVSEWGSYKPGDIPAESLSDGVCRALIADNQAREIDVATFVRRSIEAETKKIEAKLAAAQPPANVERSRGNPPTGGLDFQRIGDTGTRPSDEAKNLCLADAMRCIFLTQARDVDPGLARFGRERLRHYVSEVRHYEGDPATGEVRTRIERTIGPDGKGLEVITRDGTDSLAGGGGYGFTLRPNYIGDLFVVPIGQQVFAPACEIIPMAQGNETRYPALGQFVAPKVVNGIPMPAGLGGVSVYFKSEAAPRTATDAQVRMIDFKAEDATALTKFSRDYIVDNFIAMNQKITERIGMALGVVKDWCTIFGSGVGMPEGFANSKAFIQRTRASAGHILYEDVVYMMSRMAAGCLTSARWLTNQTTMPELMSIKDAAGNRVFLPNSMVTQADLPSYIGKTQGPDRNGTRLMGTLQGLPVFFSEYVPALGQANDLMLACPSQYGLAQRSGVEVMVSDQVYFETDEIGFKYKERYDGKSLWPAPYIQADNLAAPGSGTQVSPFIGITVS